MLFLIPLFYPKHKNTRALSLTTGDRHPCRDGTDRTDAIHRGTVSAGEQRVLLLFFSMIFFPSSSSITISLRKKESSSPPPSPSRARPHSASARCPVPAPIQLMPLPLLRRDGASRLAPTPRRCPLLRRRHSIGGR